MKTLYYKGTHRHSFRPEEWAEVTGTMELNNHLCFTLLYSDGVVDVAPIIDIGNYTLKEE